MKVFGFLLTAVCLSVVHGEANDLFRPFPDNANHDLSLIKWAPVPFRVQYHGFVESSKLNRYIFMVDGEMVYLQPGEIAQQQFILKQVLLNGQQVLIEDMRTNELQVLKSGETSYIPGKFNSELLDKRNGERLVFSDTKNSHKTEDREILVSQKDTDLYVWEITKDQEPILCVFPTRLSK